MKFLSKAIRSQSRPILPRCLALLMLASVAASALPGLAPQAALAQRRAYIAQNSGGGDPDDDSRQGSYGEANTGGGGGNANPNRKPPPQLDCLGTVTYWMHDAIGYHPCIIMALESADKNIDLTTSPINVQAQFRMLSTGILLRSNTVVNFTMPPPSHQTIYAMLYSKRPFELSIDKNDWPVIECKVLCKVGDVDNDDAQNLGIYRVTAEAWSDEDARGQLNWRLGQVLAQRRSQKNAAASASSYTPIKGPTPVKKSLPEKALVATAGILGAPLPKPPQPPPPPSPTAFEPYLLKNPLPGLGDDFYQFEKAFGVPPANDVDNRDRDWTWVAYRKNPQVTIFAGSKGRTGKVDVVIASIHSDVTLSDTMFGNISRALSAKFKSEKLGPAEHSVLYGPGGRIELANISGQSYRASYFTTQDADQSKYAIVAVSRQPQAVSELLKIEGLRTDILRFLLKGLGAQ